MTDIEAMNATLRNMQEETEKLSRLLHCLLQAGTLMERLVRVSGDLGAVLDQLHMHGNRMQHATLRRQPTMTMQQLYERRHVSLKRHRVQYERQHGVIDKTDDQAEDEIDHQVTHRNNMLHLATLGPRPNRGCRP